jgi:GNAT superfamily N-acetyltransferase
MKNRGVKMDVTIRKAKPEECNILTDISFASKRFWNYPEAYFDVWKKELTITAAYVQKNIVNVAEIKGAILGYYSIIKNEKDMWVGKVFIREGHWLEHFFIRPEFIGKGLGTQLIKNIQEACKEVGIKKIYIFSDPNAKGFYTRIGADYIQESPSSIEGRTVCFFEMKIK